jgi:hypothetical protein
MRPGAAVPFDGPCRDGDTLVVVGERLTGVATEELIREIDEITLLAGTWRPSPVRSIIHFCGEFRYPYSGYSVAR